MARACSAVQVKGRPVSTEDAEHRGMPSRCSVTALARVELAHVFDGVVLGAAVGTTRDTLREAARSRPAGEKDSEVATADTGSGLGMLADAAA